ncbi:hypothetical protein [Bifidobacterium aquikefiricola]|uniref:Alkylhydroperoxidase n=1 Tax=Bifidobacterium aquikefiricola TaxID=3059038 RepID=A0AB39U762_9BIFI
MARVAFATEENLNDDSLEEYRRLESAGKLSNMKRALLRDQATYEAYMAWYVSWQRLAEIIGTRAATVYAHAISTTNSCQLCSLFFVHDLRELGLDPSSFETTEEEELLQSLAQHIVKNPTTVPDSLFADLHEHYTDAEIIVLVGFAGQMIATNNFNSVLKIDVDSRLLPLQDEFHPATWRDAIPQ